MTEAELIQTAQDVWGNYMATVTLSISIISAYLVVAYVVGNDLSRSQVAFINLLFTIILAFSTAAAFLYARVGTEMADLAIEMSTQRTVRGMSQSPIITVIMNVLIMSGCYKFMWDVRHPKTE